MKQVELWWLPESSHFWSPSVRGKLCVNSLGEGDSDPGCPRFLDLSCRPGSILLSELRSPGERHAGQLDFGLLPCRWSALYLWRIKSGRVVIDKTEEEKNPNLENGSRKKKIQSGVNYEKLLGAVFFSSPAGNQQRTALLSKVVGHWGVPLLHQLHPESCLHPGQGGAGDLRALRALWCHICRP